jgi:hypothetical protein
VNPAHAVLCIFNHLSNAKCRGADAPLSPAMMTYENESYGFAFLRNIWRPSWGWAAFAAILTISSLHYVSRQPPFLYQDFKP